MPSPPPPPLRPINPDNLPAIEQFAAMYPFPLDDFQRSAADTLLSGESVMVAAPTGTGKALASHTRVVTPTGYRRIDELRVGDAVIGADGKSTTVLGVYPQGERPAWEVTFSDGVSVTCDIDHLWTVNTKSRRYEGAPWRHLTLRQILAEGLRDGIGNRHFIPTVEPVEFAPSVEEREPAALEFARLRTDLTQRQLAARIGVSQSSVTYWETGRSTVPPALASSLELAIEEAGAKHRIDPYVLGLLLGDGSFANAILMFTSADVSLVEAVGTGIPEAARMVRLESRPYDWQVTSARRRMRNPVVEAIRRLGLWGCRSHDKFIPDSYKFASVADRVAMLQGLLDSDGSVDERGIVEFSTASPLLAADVAFLVRSLGGRVRIRTKQTTHRLAYRLHPTLPSWVEPFRLERKRVRYVRDPRRGPTRAISSVREVGTAEMVCIKVAALDGLFVVEDFVVTHNTIVADFAIHDAFKRAGRVFYTTPIKALSNQKYRDLSAIYGDEVGLLTGDVSEKREARILVMTTEILRNMLLQAPWEVDDVEAIVFDEIHFLADPERGTTWEEAIILCPEHIQLVCLSATVSNAPEIAAWISRTHRPIRLITHLRRAVPLALYYFVDQELNVVVDHTGDLVRDFPHTGGEAKRSPARTGRNAREKADPGMEEPQPHEIIDALTTGDMLPVIYFLFSRADCQSFAERLAAMRPGLVTAEQRGRIDAILDSYSAALRPEDRELTQVALITDLARKGIGFHHAGLLPVLKQLVEVLFTRGLMQVVLATDTLALGVNMPARSVVIGRMSKWDGRRRRTLIANEFQQMAGRAGRRGMDAFGHVVTPYSPWISFRDMLEVATGELEPVRSAFAVRYNTVLHLWDPPSGDRVRQMLRQSLAQFQTSQRIRQLEDDILEIAAETAGVPRGCLIGYDAGDELLDDYRRVVAVLTTAEQKGRRTAREVAELARDGETLPWPEPGRPALRKKFRHAPTGLIVFTRDRGWGVYVGRGARGGIGLFLFGSDIRLIQEYREIAQVSDAPPVEIPAGLIEPPDTVRDAARLVSQEELDQLWAAVAALDLPDLAAELEAHRSKADARAADDRRRADAVADGAAEAVRELDDERQRHPCHPCPRRKEHRDYLTRIESLDREAAALEQVLARETDAEEARIRSVIWGIREVLHRFGYFRRGYATEKADQLAGLFDNDGLILCELIDRRLLDDLLPEELAEVFSWFSFDRDSRYANHFELPASLVRFRRRLEEVEHAVITEEREHGIFISEGHNPNFYGAARAWCQEATMTAIGAAIELSEGDLVLTFNKTIDLLGQVREMLEDVLPAHPLIGGLRAAVRLMKRGIVQQSLTLGFNPIPLEEEQGARSGEQGRTDADAALPTSGDSDDEAPPVEEPRRKRAPRTKKAVAVEAVTKADVVAAKPVKRARKPKMVATEADVPSPS